ncbi:MAG TPA: response regulator transcription factor [Chitinophagales bacterium]|nr:response regulator transcription factor [Chitinophagales bacterium]HMU68531.1 response regulator transcription factor [Chitinophagales bacterium]HMX04166.1 response regulator transcription factor [Chitinophagales bacterium]HMZ89617.1 response regulator transcription factor [Chitinophagales bacterium]HNA57452.1 response regulator transcription factor [Chitinophagales bacterium]
MEEIKTKILLVEDDPNFGAVLKDYLTMNGYEVRLATDGEKGEDLFFKEEFNLCVLDVMMPKKDGFSLAAQIKRVNPDQPVIFLTAKTLQDDVLEGFKTGADDYITKPFNSEELLYRIAAVLKRGGKARTNNQQKEFNVGKYHFNYKTRMLKNGDSEAKLSPKEAELLRLFCMKVNDIVYREEALKQIWGRDDYFTARSMDVFVTKLRKYLKDDPTLEIVNIHGNGFRLNAEETANI